MDCIELENLYVKAKIKLKGAELCSLISKQDNTEYIWQAETIWAKHAPILFPFVGRLKNDSFIFENKEYKYTQHGFARDSMFEVVEYNKTKVIFKLTQSETTLKIYPFNFILEITFLLNNNKLSIQSRVLNNWSNDLYFSLGYHPAFAIPFTNNTTFEDYYLEFSDKEKLNRWEIEDGLIKEEAECILDNTNILKLSHELFLKDALVFKNMKSSEIKIKAKNTNKSLAFSFYNAPFFGIWSKDKANFVCLEPWHGIADTKQTNSLFIEKEGIIKLKQSEVFTSGYDITVQ